MGEVYDRMPTEEQRDIQDAILKLLEEKNCSVRTADMILNQVASTPSSQK